MIINDRSITNYPNLYRGNHLANAGKGGWRSLDRCPEADFPLSAMPAV